MTHTLTMPATAKPMSVRFTPAESDYSPVAGLLVVEQGKASAAYIVTEFTAGFPGRGFHVAKVEGVGSDKDEAAYDVFCSTRGAEWDSCSCRGFVRWGKCKHAGAVRECVANGWL